MTTQQGNILDLSKCFMDGHLINCTTHPPLTSALIFHPFGRMPMMMMMMMNLMSQIPITTPTAPVSDKSISSLCVPLLFLLRVANGVGVDLALVEAAVAVAGGTDEGCAGSLLPGRHELPATIDCVSAYAGSMVLPALLVLNHLLLLGCGAIGVLPWGLVMKAHSGVRGVEGMGRKKRREGGRELGGE
ncbi:hypothetical protein C4D60_Mb08t08650 [Musa balbisiana]|uniref:Uncharacterized protein n=1 Tax=Musa balbisiana TaxID=52838 RepID=A0A4S8K2D7_MUSBA|nr:hypothetical protein C4D60_Mb08t08650 [Musa balbisiana]